MHRDREAVAEFIFAAALFDLDGTLVHSIAAVDRAWTRWCEHASLDPEKVLPQIHGRRAIDSLHRIAPDRNAHEELQILEGFESMDTEGIHPVPGAIELLLGLQVPWAIVTSGSRVVATARIQASGLPDPPVLVCGDDVEHGKPSPAPFLLGAKRLGVAARETLAFEDSPAGITSALAAGSTVIGVSEAPLQGVSLTIANFLYCHVSPTVRAHSWRFHVSRP